MAFKAIDKTDIVSVVVSTDPAVDLENSNFGLYHQTFDESHLAFVDGEEPTRFILGTISYVKFQGIKDRYIGFDVSPDGTQNITTNIFGLTAEALAFSLKKIENGPFDVKIVNGKASDQTMDKLGSIGVVEELGNVALAINGFGDAETKKP